jgi:carbon monoxide dehydrogenase subunit G
MAGANLIPISEKTTIAGSSAEVWALIAEPMTVVACLPGATITAEPPAAQSATGESSRTYEALITVKFGPTTAKFTGEVTVAYDSAARRCNVEGRGIDQRGASRARVALTVAVEESDPAVLSVQGGFNVAGPLETFASAGGVHLARALLGEFGKNVAALIQARRDQQGADAASATRTTPQASSDAAMPAAGAELRGGKILWMAFLSWLRQLLGRK